MHRYYFHISTTAVWYAMIADCNKQFVKNWRTKKKMLKAIGQYEHIQTSDAPPVTWFEVPSETFATFVMLKYDLTPVEKR
jgi:CelD/BcsL family acetyltransferase involved in cellulose biosynthesis